MSWVSDYKYSIFELFAMNVIRAGGHLPYHIAFVMDGNRRYATSQHLRKVEGHSKGFDKLADCLRWCLDMGIREVTTFAFSIENFKRSEDEVTGLMDLAREKFSKVLQELPRLLENGVRIRVIGNISLLPHDLQKLIAEAMLKTENNDKLFLNIAFSYTSRDDVTQAIETVLTQGKDLKEEDISERLLEECLYTSHSQPPDLLFRTSGETRISDFLMWHVSVVACKIHVHNSTNNFMGFIAIIHSIIFYKNSMATNNYLEFLGRYILLSTYQPTGFQTSTTFGACQSS